MSNMSVEEYADYQLFWSVVTLTQPIVSLGGQNRMRLRSIPNSLVPFIVQSILLTFPILLFCIYRDFHPVSVCAGLIVTIVSYIIAFLESQKKLNGASLYKFVWLFISSLLTLYLLRYFGSYSRVYSVIFAGIVILIFSYPVLRNISFRHVDWFLPWKFNSDLYGIELSFLFIVFNTIFTHNRSQVTFIDTAEIVTLSTTGFFVMNLIVFTSRPVVLLSELGVKELGYWRSKVINYWPILLSILIICFFSIIRILFFSEDAYTLSIFSYFPWIILGCIRSYVDIFTPKIYKKWRLCIMGILLCCVYFSLWTILSSSDIALVISFITAFFYALYFNSSK